MSAKKYESRNFRDGDTAWSDWQACTVEEFEKYAKDNSFQVRQVEGIEYGWCTTTPNPRSPSTGWDAGQRGWRLHLVPKDQPQHWYYGKYKAPSLCGIRARHGWGLDMFIEDECERCTAIAEKRGIEFPDNS